jgi:hypothetical protein
MNMYEVARNEAIALGILPEFECLEKAKDDAWHKHTRPHKHISGIKLPTEAYYEAIKPFVAAYSAARKKAIELRN